MFQNTIVLIKGGGDLGSGVAMRMHRVGFSVVVTEIERPMMVRRSVSFGEAVFAGKIQVEEIHASRCGIDDVHVLLEERVIPVLVDPEATAVARLRPQVVVDAIMAKRNVNTAITDAPMVIALGPGFTASADCHAVVETRRGHTLGRVIWSGPASADTGQPGEVPGFGERGSRVLRAPNDGFVHADYPIGARIEEGARIATVVGEEGEPGGAVIAPFDGVLRGIVHPSVPVTAGMKIGDLDPRVEPRNCFLVSDKSLAIGGGVLEAVLMMMNRMGK
jgi:xanthine dehydrogenase accessory factor